MIEDKPDKISDNNNIVNSCKLYIRNHIVLMIVSVISIAFTIALSSLLFGMYFALGVILLRIIHEIGHYLVAKQLNFTVDKFAFYPFMAYIKFKETAKNCREDAILAFGGPIAEIGIAIAYLILYFITRENVCLVLSFLGFIISLINLIPANPFDGGHITGAINPKMWLIGISILVIIFIYDHEPLYLVLIFIAVLDCYKTLKNHNDIELIEYYKIDSRSRFVITVLYFSLITVLFVILIYMHYVVDIKIFFLELLKI